MSPMPQKFIGIKTCLWAKRPSKLLNDLRPKKHPYIWRREKSKETMEGGRERCAMQYIWWLLQKDFQRLLGHCPSQGITLKSQVKISQTMAPIVIFVLPSESPWWVGVHWVNFTMFGVWTYDGEFIEYWKKVHWKSFK